MNPIALSKEVEERYRRYLKTTFYFKDPDLRASFEDALNSGHLSKGPYLEATPVFKRTQTPQALFPNLLGSRLDEEFLKAVEGDRRLYAHQEEAIRKVFEGDNVIVATGTGSGKTESFLYPILLHLYREFLADKLCSGVRALVLYPMNALANDQRERLGQICKRLEEERSPFRFTFGQYIGETPEDEHDSRRHARDHIAHRLPGELVLRSEMRQAQPHILLTNYSMLEYLLLRPDDSPLFDNGSAQWWTFLVLDEAHQYRGSRGIEMAMLLRRLKQRLREGGCNDPFRCIATSASLTGGGEDRGAVAKFASDLFGEQFREGDVILGESESIPEPGSERFSPDIYNLLTEASRGQKEAINRLAELARKLGIPLLSNTDLSKTIGQIIQYDGRATQLRRLITASPVEVQEITSQVFNEVPDQLQISALSELVEILLWAKDPVSGAPLLSVRYHLFLRALEGAFVSYWPRKKVFLDRKAGDEGHVAFEVALCRECGQHYFVGRKGLSGGKLTEAIRDPSHDNFGATFFRPIENVGEENEEEDSDNVSTRQVFQLCAECGELSRGKLQCGHVNSVQVVREESPKDKDEDRADQMAKCGACGYNAAGRDPVREVVHGTDGPNAVIATTLYQSLPEKRKKVLAFADGRQEAAFFAWYLEDSYKDILSRNLVLKVAQRLSSHTGEGLSLRELATDLRNIFLEKRVFPSTTGDLELRHKAWCRLYHEFLTDEQRISLEGVGLVRWMVKWPAWCKIAEVLLHPPWSLSEQEAHDLVLVLLDSMRTDRAVEIRTESGPSVTWRDLDLQTSQMRIRIKSDRHGKRGGERNESVRSWDGEKGKRAQFLTKLLEKSGVPKQEALEQAGRTLRAIWETVCQGDETAPSSRERLLISVEDARRLNPDWWRLGLVTDDHEIFQCNTCGRLQSVSVRGVCPRPRCPGTLKAMYRKNLGPNHYRFLYEEDLPGSLRVEEHTAQLDHEKAREFQKEFKEGKIHVLSCSTTFELGVDLGDLDTIFLRNVPPEAFNYAQRVGRAGRRIGHAGFAITYCRRGPHDLYHFSEPNRMLSGKVRPPVISLRNEKIIARHITATALSAFFRDDKERFGMVEKLFKNFENPSGVADFKAFLDKHKAKLEESLWAIVPPDVVSGIGLGDGSWIQQLTGENSKITLAEEELSSDYQTIKNLEITEAQKGNYTTAQWAKARAKTISEEDMLSFLSRKAVIPKYGFPVDVVELDTHRTQQGQESREVSLQRDLTIAVAEFAPTSKLIANKKVWTSYGLKKVAEKEWDRWRYAKCAKHNRFERSRYTGENQLPNFEQCCQKMISYEYIDPKFGFLTSLEKPEEPKQRPAKVFTTRPYFAGFKDKQGDTIDFGNIKLTKASPGYLVVLCEGRRGEGFYVCRSCGAGFRKREKTHKTPYNQPCRGTFEPPVSLGHEFVTDVLQLQFQQKPSGTIESVQFAHSLAYALVEGAAEVLEVPSTDLSATIGYSEQYPVPPIVLYDNVPGGAGLVARLETKEILETCLEAARRRVSGNCGCDENTSCYGCLRSYRNQFVHQDLQRGPVMHYLESLLSKWRALGYS